MPKIKNITLYFPNSNTEEIVFYQVGNPSLANRTGKVVTEIKKAMRPGELAMIPYYEIFTEDGLVAEMHQYGIIEYFTEEKND